MIERCQSPLLNPRDYRRGYVSGFTGKMVYVVDIEGNYIKQPNKLYKQIPVKELKHIKRNNNWIMQEVAA